MAEAIAILLVGFSLVVLSAPFMRMTLPRRPTPDAAPQFRQRREAMYQEVRVLQNDLSLGHISQAEYDRRFQEYRIQAAELLKEEERIAELDRRLEEEIKGRRGRRQRPGQGQGDQHARTSKGQRDP